MHNADPLFEKDELGESDEEGFDSKENSEEDYEEEEYDDLGIMWHQLMGTDFMGSKGMIMRSMDWRTKKMEPCRNLKCTFDH